MGRYGTARQNTGTRDRAARGLRVRTGVAELLLLLGKVGAAHDADRDALPQRLDELNHVGKDFLFFVFVFVFVFQSFFLQFLEGKRGAWKEAEQATK